MGTPERTRTGHRQRPFMTFSVSMHMSHRELYISFFFIWDIWILKHSLDIGSPTFYYLKKFNSVLVKTFLSWACHSSPWVETFLEGLMTFSCIVHCLALPEWLYKSCFSLKTWKLTVYFEVGMGGVKEGLK